MEIPLFRFVSSRIFSLNRSRLFQDMAMHVFPIRFISVNPRNFLLFARSTPLFCSFTFSLSFFSRNSLTFAMTRSPARRLLT